MFIYLSVRRLVRAVRFGHSPRDNGGSGSCSSIRASGDIRG